MGASVKVHEILDGTVFAKVTWPTAQKEVFSIIVPLKMPTSELDAGPVAEGGVVFVGATLPKHRANEALQRARDMAASFVEEYDLAETEEK